MSKRPKLLDLFCGAGGCAKGYHMAGFDVVGVDNKSQPRYPFEFIKADALMFLRSMMEDCLEENGGYSIRDFAAVHASPPCQRYSRLRHLPWMKDRGYWDSIPPTRKALEACELPWVIENVEDAPLNGMVLCGQQFGLGVFRHRLFETSFALFVPPHAKHRGVCAPGRATMAKRYAKSHVAEISRTSMAGHVAGAKRIGESMGIDWMTRDELSQAIPPAYTEFIGRQLIRIVENVRKAS